MNYNSTPNWISCCLTAPNHYLNECWIIISEVFFNTFSLEHFRTPIVDMIVPKTANSRLQPHYTGASETIVIRYWCDSILYAPYHGLIYCFYHWNGKVVRVTTLIFTGDVEGKLQRLQWISRLSPWRPLRFCDHKIIHRKMHGMMGWAVYALTSVLFWYVFLYGMYFFLRSSNGNKYQMTLTTPHKQLVTIVHISFFIYLKYWFHK